VRHRLFRIALLVMFALPLSSLAQVPVQASSDQAALLTSPNAALAANKRLVFDFWREVLEGGHLERAEHYLTESYIQHNPKVATGLAGFVEFFSKFSKPGPVNERILRPLVNVVAEGNLVVLSFVEELPDPTDASKHYTTTWFDMFRIENGKIAEHWDSAHK
jgi:predicted SnoaL-like aldol condensation-catalyzing enzyme